MQKSKSERRHATHDGSDEEESELFLVLLYKSISGSKRFITLSVGAIVIWSIICSYGASLLLEAAESKPGGSAERWVENIENGKLPLALIGTLMVFTLAFRFNTCYERWWDGRVFWGDIISKSLDLATMNRRWIADEQIGDRINRFIVVFGYACKSLLHGKSLAEEGQDGAELVSRGLLTQEELDDMHHNSCWQPYYCIEVIRALLFEAHKVPGGKGINVDENNKIHGQMFRCFDNTVKEMSNTIGDAIRVSASGLPVSYDALTMTIYFTYFFLAAVVWSLWTGWALPPLILCASLIIILLIVMGSNLVDPFGDDRVDIPMDAFCTTIEDQINAIDARSKSGIVDKIARTSTTERRTIKRRATCHIPILK